MKAWVWMTSGLIVWAVHFFGVYTIASAADVWATADAFVWRMGGLAFSGACLAACLVLVFAAAARLSRAGAAQRDGDVRDRCFPDRLAMAGSLISAIAVMWQALPNLTGY
jgi:hypothetical protein